jgi:signal transduction histidine kinase/CheY-like chemotaxis protein
MRKYFFPFLPLLLVVLAVWFGYRAFDAGHNMYRAQKRLVDAALLDKTTDLLSVTADELFEEARYYGVRGVNYLDRLEASRTRMDRTVKALRSALETSGERTWIRREDLDAFVRRIDWVRVRVDRLDRAVETFFVQDDTNRSTYRLLDRLQVLQVKFAPQGSRRTLVRYIHLVHGLQTLADERALLALFIAQKSPLEPAQLHGWERILERDPLSDIATGSGDGVDSAQHLALMRRLDAIRGDLFEHIDDGAFGTRLYDLENAWLQPLRNVHKALVDTVAELDGETRSYMQDQQRRMIGYGLLTLGLVVILFFGYRHFMVVRREKEAMEESLKEIVSDLDAQQRKELETIMEQGDRVAMYRFLARTTMEARAAEERALQAEKAKDLFLANMSHEIRTPLNGILGFTQLMQSTPLTPEQTEFMGVIEGSSDNLLKIVNDILDLSKIQADKIELESIPFSLVKHLEKAVEPHAARALEKGIDYSVYIDPTLPIVSSDPTKLMQVMSNLIGNAVKFTNEGGTVDVDVRKIKEGEETVTVRFSIKDSGIGITPEQKERIFDPFSQADSSTTREFGGTGLGLTITRNIVEQMGGTLDVVSEPGRGSEFFFELVLPRERDDEPVESRLEGLRIAYYHPGHSTLRQMERNLALYARAAGARFRMINEHERNTLDDIDILLIDYTDKTSRMYIDEFLASGVRVILLSTASQQHETDGLLQRVERVIYRPLTASKLIRACRKPEHEEAERSTQAARTLSLAGMRILVAEDNPINQKLIGRVLEGMEIETTLVNNGKEAVQMRQNYPFDAVLMDIQMPIMGGIEACKAILEYEHKHGQAHIPIIALTANALQGDRERYMREGFDDYISKPVNLEQLRQVLHRHRKASSDTEETDAVDSAKRVPKKPRSVVMFSRANTIIGRLHREALTHAGHTFWLIEHEAKLLERIENDPPDCVVIDMYSAADTLCRLLEPLHKRRIEVCVYGSVEEVCLEGVPQEYTSVAELLTILQ